VTAHVNRKYTRRHLRQLQREHFPELCVGKGDGKRRRCRHCDRDYVISFIGSGDQCKRTRFTVVVMMNCRSMTMPLPVAVNRD
jgi:hypothetical protein